MKQVTPPCPQLDPQLLTEAKELWGLHTGKRAIEALTAKEEDTLDEVVGRPPVVRCRVCHKPSETGVHPQCQTRGFLCAASPDHPRVLPPLVKPPPPNPNDPPWRFELAMSRQSLYWNTVLLIKPRCPECDSAGTTTFTDCPECRPGFSKVSRKRQQKLSLIHISEPTRPY